MELKIPAFAEEVIEKLNKEGFSAYVVGGAVRDALLGKSPRDWDIATDALTDDVKAIFKKHFDTGIKHGTVTVLADKRAIEVTTFRIDGEYRDNRRPESVEFSRSLKDDLKRRDFTINAMAYSPREGIIDYHGGTDDLKNRLIRAVGNADKRFLEDALRILRGIRFASQLDFKIEGQTLKAITKNRHLLKNISAERIREELLKIINTKNGLEILFKTEVWQVILPEVDFKDVCLKVPFECEVRLSALLYKAQSPRDFLLRLKFDNKTKNNVIGIIECAQLKIEEDEYNVKKTLSRYGKNVFLKALLVKKAYGQDTEELNKIYERVKDMPCKISQLEVGGSDVTALGIRGKDVGKALNMLLDMVIADQSLNTKEKLLDVLQK